MTSPRNTLSRISHHRRRWRASLAFVAMCIVLSVRLEAGAHAATESPGFKVIVHPSNPVTSLRADTLRQIFLKQQVRWDNGDTIKPVDLKLQSAVRAEFSREVLARSAQTVRTYWLQRIFSGGQIPPPELARTKPSSATSPPSPTPSATFLHADQQPPRRSPCAEHEPVLPIGRSRLDRADLCIIVYYSVSGCAVLVACAMMAA